MPNENILKYGILKCRDLVELYYGARMVMQAVDSNVNLNTTSAFNLLPQDPRRVAYELYLDGSAAGGQMIHLGTSADQVTNDAGIEVFVAQNTVVQINRNFLSHGDSVCQEVWGRVTNLAILVGVRSILLTPAPVDEWPTG